MNDLLKTLLIKSLVGILLSLSPLSLRAQLSCEDILSSADTKSVLRAYRDAWKIDGVYCAGYCHSNVIRLFQMLQRQVPNLRPEDVRVVYISSPNGLATERLWPGLTSSI